MDTVTKFSYNSMRSKKARFAVSIGGIWQKIFVVVGWLLLLSGLTLVLVGISVGWALAGLAALPFMITKWYSGQLHHLPTGSGKQVDDLVSGDVLGHLPQQPKPEDIAKAVLSVSSGMFMSARFGIAPDLLTSIASNPSVTTDNIWLNADNLMSESKLPHYSAPIIFSAIILSHPSRDEILAQLSLDRAALISGIQWQWHLRTLINEFHKPKRTGGIARDWSFGYTPLLSRFGQNISLNSSQGFVVDTKLHVAAIDQLINTFGNNGRQNAALVGQTGVGKTTIIRAFAAKLVDASVKLPDTLKFRQVYMLDASALIAAAPGRGELEGLVMHVLSEAYSAKNIIICLDNSQLFFEEGIGSVDLTNVLQPILEAGRLRVILSMDEQRFLQIGQRNPGLVNAVNRIQVSPSSEQETMQVLQEQLMIFESQRNVFYTYQSLKEAYRLSERYIYDLAQPGRAMKLLESASNYAQGSFVTAVSVQQAIEQTMDVKVSVASTTDDKTRLLNLEDHIHEQMINQTHAVSVVSDALRRARAGVRNQNRPIGTFLFLGPTGVGKTELSKALANVYFGGEGRMIRLDLNEFVRPEDVSRLIADGADDPNSLTAQVMKQPFSVILLDEIEKAAPEVLATLLQVLDEGILRDVKNREVSFRDAIIIATSNAGADKIRENISSGRQVADFEEEFTNELINSGQFRPEFLNRFDEIVIFTPLTKTDLMKVVDLILSGVNKTLETQKIRVDVDEDAKMILVDHGYDPRLGARPIRRVVQKAVENLVARQVLSGEVSAGGTVRISRAQVSEILGLSNGIDLGN